MADFRLERLEALNRSADEQQLWQGLLRRRTPDYKSIYHRRTEGSDITEA